MARLENLDAFCMYCYLASVERGFWEASQNLPEKLALIHSELSEALEEYRASQADLDLTKTTVIDGKPEGFAVELADALIRICCLVGRLKTFGPLDFGGVVDGKLAYNDTRPRMHGGKRC